MSTREDREQDAREDLIWDDQQAAREEGICPDCGGDGEVQSSAQYGWIGEPLWEKCRECRGTGQYGPDDAEAEYEAPQSWFLNSRRWGA